jgi:CRISPR-associated endonuclease Csn1
LYQNAVKQIKQDELNIPIPYENIREELAEKLKHTIISHVPQRKLTGALHEETGAGYIEKHGGLVYRKTLSPEFTLKNAMDIVDEQVKTKVLEHFENYPNPKEAFNAEHLALLKLGSNPIKRVRVLQSKIRTTKNKNAEFILNQTKFGVRDKTGKIFKYMSYGNTHHVEIIKNINTGKFKGEFVTMMLASHRDKGINMPKQAIIKTDHGQDWEFIMALHINDTVSIEQENDDKEYYRVQSLDIQNNKVVFILGKASTDNKEEKLYIGINKKNFDKYDIKLHNINAIGKNIDND